MVLPTQKEKEEKVIAVTGVINPTIFIKYQFKELKRYYPNFQTPSIRLLNLYFTSLIELLF